MFSFLKKKEKKVQPKKDNASKKEAYIQEVMENTGWSYELAQKNIKQAKEKTGITYRDYARFAFYLVAEEDFETEYEKILKKKERRKQQKESCITTTMEHTGWTREKAEMKIKQAKEKTGITYKDYEKYAFYSIPENQQVEKYKEISKKKKKEEKLKVQREEAIAKTMKITGWDYDFTKAKIADARKRTGCAYKEYVLYKFYELSEEEQATYFLIKQSQQIARKFDTNKEFVKILCDKELTNVHFSKYLGRPWCVNTKISLEEFTERFAESERVIYKPLDGNRGKGVEAFEINRENAKEVYDQLKLLPEGVVEQYVVQHHTLSELAPSSVNTVRIVALVSKSKPVTPDGKKMDIAYAALRIGGGTSIVDNFHSGGMVAAIDLESGKLVTDAADMDGNVFKEHPLTGKVIKGFEIPFFKEAVDMVKDACENSGIEGYLGWDIAITENGPVLIEINLRPGVVLLSTPYISEKKGMKHIMEKYM